MNERMSINDVIRVSGLSNNYVRKAIASGKLPVSKELIPGTKIEKNWIEVSDYEAWRAGISRTMRADGRNKFVIYMTADEESKVRELLGGMEVAELLVRANVKAEADTESE